MSTASSGDAGRRDPFHQRLHHVTAQELSGDTAQSGGMRRLEALSGRSVHSEKLWMGQTHVSPATASANHHHGESETGIYVVSGRPEFVFWDDDGQEVRLRAAPGDYVYVPPWGAAPRGEPVGRGGGGGRDRPDHPGGDRGQPAVVITGCSSAC